MEKLHVVTLVLEMIGFGLAYIHVFRRGIADRVNQFATDVPAMSGADSDMSMPLKTRDAVAVNSNIYKLLQIVAIIVFFLFFNFGHGFLWGVAEFFCAMIVSFPVALLAFVILAVAVNRVIALAVRAGRGHTIIGTGFFLTACGMAIETYQVWESPYRRAAIVLWSVVTVLAVETMVRRKQEPGRSNGV